MAEKMRINTISRKWLLISAVLCLFFVAANGLEGGDEGNASGRSLVLEFFMPINSPIASNPVKPRERREIEGSGDETDFSEIVEEDKVKDEKAGETVENVDDNGAGKGNGTNFEEGSGDHDDVREDDKTTENAVLIGKSEILTTTVEPLPLEVVEGDEASTEVTTVENNSDVGNIEVDVTDKPEEAITTTEESSTPVGIVHFIHTISTTQPPKEEDSSEEVTNEPEVPVVGAAETTSIHTTTTASETTTAETTGAPLVPLAPDVETDISEEEDKQEDEKKPEEVEPIEPVATTPPEITQTEEPNVEPVFTETKLVQKSLEALPGNIIQKRNMSIGVDPQLIVTDADPTESEAQMDETVSRKLGAYIVIALILLSFSSLVGYVMMRKRQNRKRREDFEGNQESHDTEKALLSLSDYKDNNSELEENHLKNNEITPIVVKSNTQINKFEKNTNFSSPKNLNTAANEKNIEKDNVLKSTAESLNQVGQVTIPEGESPAKETQPQEEEKNSPNMEKLIVKTRIDQDSIPKKPIIINRSSTGYVPIPQDGS